MLENVELLKENKKVPLNQVPAWFYDELVCGYLTKAAFLWWSNVWAMCLHIVLAVVTVIVSMMDGRTMATPKLTVYLTNLTWVSNQTNALVPRYQATEGLYLSHMVLWFFLLSALAHGTVVLFNYKQAWGCNDTDCRKLGQWCNIVSTGWYFIWIHECRNPLRWVEYSFSASLMGMVFAVAGGINHLYMVLMIFGLLWSVMFFGYHAEVVNRPVDSGTKKPVRWQNKSGIARLAPHLLGYVPYSFVWGPLLHSFFWNVTDAEQAPPAFVYAIIITQFVLFSCFGFTQFVLLFQDNGPKNYYWGEWSYQVLSLLAKGVLGMLLIVNVLLFDSFEDAVADDL